MDETRIALEALITVRESMIAENGQRVYSGQAPAYVGDNFQELADQIGSLGKGGQKTGEPGSLPGTIYLVIQKMGHKSSTINARDYIVGAFAVAEDGQKWIDRQHNSSDYLLEPLKVIGEGET